MRLLPRIRDYELQVLSDGSMKCRNCEKLVGAGRRRYCSEQCMLEFNRNHTWELVRKDVLKRDKYRCGICCQRLPKYQLDVDHIIPIKMGGNPFDKENLRVLCRSCHEEKTKLDNWALKLP